MAIPAPFKCALLAANGSLRSAAGKIGVAEPQSQV